MSLRLRGVDVLLEKLLVGLDLNLDEIRRLDGFLEFAEVDAFRHGRWSDRDVVPSNARAEELRRTGARQSEAVSEPKAIPRLVRGRR